MELYAREYGSGEPLLILHGLFGFSDNWQTIARQLSDHFRVITLDLRNHGRSPHLPEHTYPAMAQDLRDFMTQRDMDSARIMGHSMGGKAAMQLALSYPERVEKLVVVDIAPGQATDKHQAIYQTLLDIDLSRMSSRQDIEAHMAQTIPDLGVRQFLLKNLTRDDAGHLVWKMNLPVLWKHFPDILGPVNGRPFDKPSLFVRGSRSEYILDNDLPEIRRLFPAAQVHTIENAGHWVHADQPGALLDVLRAFL